MNKKLTKIIILMTCSLMLFLVGCGQEAVNNESAASAPAQEAVQTPAPTEAPTPEPTTMPVPEPTVAPTTAPTPTPTPVPDKSIEEILDALKAAGTIASDSEKVTAVPTVAGDNVEMEKVETYDNSFVIVTFNGKLENADAGDITLKKYNDNWYELSASNVNMTVKDSYATINEEGKTVIIYKVADKIQGIKAVTDTSKEKFADLKAAVTIADNYLSWQMENGGWDKGVEEQAEAPAKDYEAKNKFSGWTAQGGGEMGTIDNDATYTQMRHIAAVYREVPDEKYKESVIKGLEFVFKLQGENGGLTQVYPKRGGYSDNVTFNDNAMINTLIMLEDMRDRRYPFDSDIISDEYITKIEESINKAIDYILKAQIEVDGKLTAWCAQHDPETYEPVGARAYELPSISGSESVAVIKFLMNQEQTPEIQKAVESAIQWFKDSEVKGVKYERKDPNGVYFVEDAGSSIWYRFYDLETNEPIFCDRDGVKKRNILEISEERRHGYSWAGTYPKKLLEIYDSHGYYAGRIEAVVTNTNSKTADGKTLAKDSVMRAEAEIAAE